MMLKISGFPYLIIFYHHTKKDKKKKKNPDNAVVHNPGVDME